jgi:hypothetical protein
MPGIEKIKLTDDLIREALQCEIDSIIIPSADEAWIGIEAVLADPRLQRPAKRRFYTWYRMATVAAACLLVVLGAAGLFRAAQFSAPLADTEMIADSEIGFGGADDMAALQVEDLPAEAEADATKDESIKIFVEEIPPLLGEIDPMPPDWPLSLPEDYALGEAIILFAGGEPFYQGAFYNDADADLLLVKSSVADEDLELFLDHLGRHLQLNLFPVGKTEEFTVFTFEESSGLARQTADGNQALLDLSGSISSEELVNMAQALD